MLKPSEAAKKKNPTNAFIWELCCQVIGICRYLQNIIFNILCASFMSQW